MLGTNFVFSGVFKCLSECMCMICCGFPFFKTTLIITNDFFLHVTADCYTVCLRRSHMQYLVTWWLCNLYILMGRLFVYWTNYVFFPYFWYFFFVLHTLRMILRGALRCIGFPNLIHAACMLFGPAALLFLNLSIAISTSSVVELFNHPFLSSSSDLFFRVTSSLLQIIFYFKQFLKMLAPSSYNIMFVICKFSIHFPTRDLGLNCLLMLLINL